MTDRRQVYAWFVCKTCVMAGEEFSLEVGILYDEKGAKIYIGCQNCGNPVAIFRADPVPRIEMKR